MRPREDYGHPGPLGPALDLSRVTGVDLHHSAGGFTSNVTGDLRSIAQTGVNRFGRSSYNYAIHPRSNAVWEMQGLHRGAHNDGENSTRLGLVVLGNYESATPSTMVVDLVAEFVTHAHQSGWITQPHIKGHRDTDATACPGKHLHSRLPDIRLTIEENDMAFSREEEKILKEIVAAIKEKGSNGWSFKYMIEHLRDHPSGGGGDHNHDGRYLKGVREVK